MQETVKTQEDQKSTTNSQKVAALHIMSAIQGDTITSDDKNQMVGVKEEEKSVTSNRTDPKANTASRKSVLKVVP